MSVESCVRTVRLMPKHADDRFSSLIDEKDHDQEEVEIAEATEIEITDNHR